jgi:type VI secretion system protein ImpH
VATKERKSGSSLKERLSKEFPSFSFFKAVELIESFSSEKKPLGEALSPHEEPVRFSVKPGLSFPPSEISDLNQKDEKGPINMGVTFMGFIGPSGVLPYWYNELALERASYKDFAFSAFLDVFHHRLISLFYLAWKKHSFPVNYLPEARDRFSKYLLSLIGLGTPGLTDMMKLPLESFIFYSGLLSRQIPSAIALEAIVGYFSGTHAKVWQFINRIITFDTEDQTQLGLLNGQLGVDAVCGNSTWENQTSFCVDLGPMAYNRFVRFLPSGDMLNSVFRLVRFTAGIEYEFEIRVFLKREEVPPCILGRKTPTSPWLGWTTWIKSAEMIHKEDPYVTF